MKVYLVEKTYWDMMEILGVYKTKAGARKRIKKEKEEWESDSSFYQILEFEVLDADR